MSESSAGIRHYPSSVNGIELLEGHAMSDHVHLCLSIPPNYSVSYTVGFLKGESAVRIHRELLRERRITGLHFWAVGYWVSTVGRDEATVRKYVRDQDVSDRQQGELCEYMEGQAKMSPSGAFQM